MNLFHYIREQNKLRKFRNNLSKGERVLVRLSDIEAIEAAIVFISKLEHKVIIHTKDHPYEAVEMSRIFPIHPINN